MTSVSAQTFSIRTSASATKVLAIIDMPKERNQAEGVRDAPNCFAVMAGPPGNCGIAT
jgi:hypothetical protein